MRLLNFFSFKKKIDMEELKKAQAISAELVHKKLKLAKLEELDGKLLHQLKGIQESSKYIEMSKDVINKDKIIKELEQIRDEISTLKKDIDKDEVFLKIIKKKTDLIIQQNKNKVQPKQPIDDKQLQNQKNLLFNNVKSEFQNLIEYYKRNCIDENTTNTLLIIDMISNHIDIILKEEPSLKNSIELSKKFLSLLKNRLCKLSQEQLNNIFYDYIDLLTNRKLNNNTIMQLFK